MAGRGRLTLDNSPWNSATSDFKANKPSSHTAMKTGGLHRAYTTYSAEHFQHLLVFHADLNCVVNTRPSAASTGLV